MSRSLKLAFLAVASFGLLSAALTPLPNPSSEKENPEMLPPSPDFANIPLYFIANLGQKDPEARFYARTSRYVLWLTETGLVFDAGPDGSKLMFLGSRPHPDIEGREPADYRVNSFIGNDPSAWRHDIPTMRAVEYRDLYKDIDLVIRGVEREVEYDWIVRPGGDPAAIRFAYEGAVRTRIDKKGDLHVQTGLGEIIHRKPIISYQNEGGRRIEVGGGYRCIRANAYGFDIGPYDTGRDLVIDPVVIPFSTFLGGAGDEYGKGISIDSAGAVYVTGYTKSADFPKKTPYDPASNGSYDAFLTKFNPGGKTLAYSTFFGGSKDDFGDGIAIDGEGNAVIAGETASLNFPAFKALDKSLSGPSDAFIAKFSSTGKAPLFSTLLGGKKDDAGKDVVVDSAGNIYVTGWTGSSDFPAKNAYDPTYNGGNRDAFLSKLSPSGQTLFFNTYLGGSSDDYGYVVAVDGAGSAYLSGHTESNDFPLKNPFRQARAGKGDAFVTKFSPTGKALVYSTYLGGSNDEWGYGIAVDSSGNAYLSGETESPNFPVKKAYDASYNGGDGDAFLTKFVPAGYAIAFSTFLGGKGEDVANDICLDPAGFIYLTGNSGSVDFPILNAFDANQNGGDDIFVTAFEPTGKKLNYSTYLGGRKYDNATDIAVDDAGNAYIVGRSLSLDFPAINAFDKTLGGSMDVVVVKLTRSGASWAGIGSEKAKRKSGGLP